jgi:hypothetical protein
MFNGLSSPVFPPLPRLQLTRVQIPVSATQTSVWCT